jgi:hypothetical protein
MGGGAKKEIKAFLSRLFAKGRGRESGISSS